MTKEVTEAALAMLFLFILCLNHVLCVQPLQMILENNPLHMPGMIGAVYISFGHFCYEIVPQPHAENWLTPKAVRSLLCNILSQFYSDSCYLLSVLFYII